MKQLLQLIVITLLLTYVVWGQSTSVTGQVTDAGAQAWNNGTYTFTFFGGNDAQWQGGAFNRTVTGSLNATGGISAVSIPDNNFFTQAGTKWYVNVCAATFPKLCFTQLTLITGVSQVLTITPPTIAISVPTVVTNPPPLVVAYTDSEIVGGWVGFTYYNLVGSSNHTCSAFSASSCTAWSAGGGSLPAGCTGSGGAITCTGGFITPQSMSAQCLTLWQPSGNGTNNVQWCAPTTLAANRVWRFPNLDASGPLISDGAGNTSYASTTGSGVYMLATDGAFGHGILQSCQNDTVTGTTVNLLIKLNTHAPSQCINATTADTAGSVVFGVCATNCGTGVLAAGIAIHGVFPIVYDNATTAGDCVVVSTTTAGNAHDVGSATCPTGVTIIGRVTITNASSGQTLDTELMFIEARAPTSFIATSFVNNQVAASSDVAFNPVGQVVSTAIANGGQVAMRISRAGVMKNFWIQTTTGQSATGSLTMSIRRQPGCSGAFNAANLTIVVAAGGAAAWAGDTTHTETFAAGDCYAVEVNNAATTTSAQISVFQVELQ